MPDTYRLTLALDLLHQNARPAELAGMARFGIVGDQRWLSVPAMCGIARTWARPRVGPSPVGHRHPRRPHRRQHGGRSRTTDRAPDGRLGQGLCRVGCV